MVPLLEKVTKGDILIVYCFMNFKETEKFKPSLVFTNEKDNTLT